MHLHGSGNEFLDIAVAIQTTRAKTALHHAKIILHSKRENSQKDTVACGLKRRLQMTSLLGGYAVDLHHSVVGKQTRVKNR